MGGGDRGLGGRLIGQRLDCTRTRLGVVSYIQQGSLGESMLRFNGMAMMAMKRPESRREVVGPP